MLCHQNVFTGPLHLVFDPSNVHTSLEVVNVGENRFSGYLPVWSSVTSRHDKDYDKGSSHHNDHSNIRRTLNEVSSEGSQLTTFVAAVNCLDNEASNIATSFCGLSSLTTLILDGLQAAPGCQPSSSTSTPLHTAEQEKRHRSFRSRVHGMSSSDTDGGTSDGGVRWFQTMTSAFVDPAHLPACLFTSMPSLTTLHLAGNGWRGKLPDINVLNDRSAGTNATTCALRDLSLSNNAFTGHIPVELLLLRSSNTTTNTSRNSTTQWQNLDLSFNKFTGSLPASMFSPMMPVSSSGMESTAISVMDASVDVVSTTTASLSLSLSLNRLSGAIPRGLLTVTDISLLRGNLFSCAGEGHALKSAAAASSDRYVRVM